MSLLVEQGVPVHKPADPNKFQFDPEVSSIFPNMAVRSIPNYVQAHQAHARMLKDWVKPGAQILDIGASRGAFLDTLKQTYGQDVNGAKLNAIDNSESMCKMLSFDHPEAYVLHADIAQPDFGLQPQFFDVVCVNYVLQFIDPAHQIAVMLKIFKSVKTGGVLLWGHKSMYYGFSGHAAHEEYIRFRMENGYTLEEIEAKTKALKGSMFPMDHDKLMHTMRMYFSEVTETFRFMMFSTIFAVK